MSGVLKIRRLWLAGLLMSTAVGVLAFSNLVAAQDQSGWSVPELIYETTESIDTPYLVSDANGITHLVWRESTRDTSSGNAGLEAIFYASDFGGNWSQGRDIIAMSSAVGPTTAVDSNGMIHLVWQGPGTTLYHSLARVDSARTAHGWVDPMALVISNSSAHSSFDGEHTLHIVYPGLGSSGVFYIRYDVMSDIWSTPTTISPTAANNTLTNYARLAIEPDGTLHAVWSEFLLPEAWPPTGVYYSRSENNGISWTGPVELAGDGYDQITVAAAPDGIHVVWNGMVGIGGRYHRWSNDDGRTWSPTEAIVPPGQGGTEGLPQLQVDNAGTLHLLTTFNGCAWYANWKGGNWSRLNCISGREAMATNYIEQPALTLANGNQLHAVFWDDRARLWHTTMMTGAPPTFENLPVLEPLATLTATPSPIPTATAIATPLPASIFSAGAPPAVETNASPAWTLFLSAVAALALLGVTLLIRTKRPR